MQKQPKIKILELFGGIGACTKALKRLNIPIEVVDYVEVDRYAVDSYNAINNTHFTPQDITKWDKQIDVDLIMHGSPCQDFSIAGRQAGGDEGSGTRSSLLYKTLEIVENLHPKYVIWENVKNLWSYKHRHNWEAYVNKLKELGYNSYGSILNAKDFGIPQNRERLFTISIRKDIDKGYIFPSPKPLTLFLKDMLENNVEDKYFISERMMRYLTGVDQKSSKFPRGDRFLANMNRKHQEIANTITTNAGNRPTDNFIKVRTANKIGYDIATDGDAIDLQYPNSTTRRGRVGHGVSKTIMTQDLMGVFDGCRIRKLTPKECWRLMGFDDEDYEKAAKVNSNTQLYKQAGNSIVVNVLEAILTYLLEDEL